MPTITHTTAQAWINRWDRQQEGCMPDREDRFTAIIDAVQAATTRPDPLVLDLGCGPGSLAARLLDRIPSATVIAVDTDPLLLELGRAGYAQRTGLRFTELDLRAPGWGTSLGLDRPADAAVTTTAFHWLPEPDLRNVYEELATTLRPGGIFLNGDHLGVNDTAPRLAALEEAAVDQATRRRFDTPPEGWREWWKAISTELGAPPQAAAAHHGSETGHLSTHVTALRAAGFTEIGTLWQRGNDRVLCALTSPA